MAALATSLLSLVIPFVVITILVLLLVLVLILLRRMLFRTRNAAVRQVHKSPWQHGKSLHR
jgi:hypothetical protein